MNIYDCFMYFDEDLLLDLRLNILDRYVKKFIITEATYTHNGTPKKLNFDLNNFAKFKDKISYIVIDNPPPDIKKINVNDSEEIRGEKLILNGMARDYFQRENLSKGLNDAQEDDFIMISDLDEIPNLEKLNFEINKDQIIIFKQKMFYYKLNLYYEEFDWYGSKACRKKNFISPQWLRNIKSKRYPKWRFDLIFSKKKYTNIFHVENGGWHFTCLKKAEDLEKKLLNFAHHYEYEESGLNIKDIKKLIDEKRVMYDHNVDKKEFKWSGSTKLRKIDLHQLPSYISKNLSQYREWLD
jgi:beta-1,4-mannosyl-glycoprotein beta-1,4-N-acetylglucosaminyltransferase